MKLKWDDAYFSSSRCSSGIASSRVYTIRISVDELLAHARVERGEYYSDVGYVSGTLSISHPPPPSLVFGRYEPSYTNQYCGYETTRRKERMRSRNFIFTFV